MKALILSLMLLALPTFAQDKEAESTIANFDNSYYHPEKKGLKDLKVKITIPDLAKVLSDNKFIGQLKDVYFELYYENPERVFVDIKGMPQGFDEHKATLRGIILSRLEFIIPQYLKDKFKGLTLRMGKGDSDEKVVKVTNPKNFNEDLAIFLHFNKKGILKKIENKLEYNQNEVTDLSMDTKSWSDGKVVTEKTEVVSDNNGMYTKITNQIKYTSVNGFGFPEQFDSSTYQKNTVKVAVNAGKKDIKPEDIKYEDKTFEQEFSFRMNFVDYKVNEGEATKMFKKLKALADPIDVKQN